KFNATEVFFIQFTIVVFCMAVVKYLIKRYNLKPQHSDDTFKDYSQVAYNEHLHSKFNATEVFFIQFTIVVFCMAVVKYLIKRYNLKPQHSDDTFKD
ncbi:sodium/glutamate symporter, partial [Staphylococcus aureus]|uniref:sodium/glutamate symporter n=1 Tax=Staphylococcus aureus TaxID=1280 RepID=UPI00210BC2CE